MSSLGAYMYLYAFLPLRLSFSTNLPSAIHLLPHFASVANTEPTLSYIHISIFAEKRKKIRNPDQVFWITAGICGTVFEDFLLFGQYRTWCILRIMNDSGAAQRAQIWFFPFFFLSFSFFFFLFLLLSFIFASLAPSFGTRPFQQTSFSQLHLLILTQGISIPSLLTLY